MDNISIAKVLELAAQNIVPIGAAVATVLVTARLRALPKNRVIKVEEGYVTGFANK